MQLNLCTQADVLAAAAAQGVLHPVLIVILCVVAGIGTVMMLPSRKEAGWAKLGGVVALAAGLVFVALLVRHAADRGGMGAYFWIFSAVAIVGALRVITHPRPVYSALYFVLTVFASAGLFVLLWAEFMAAALIVIYAGAILVTYVFVIMLAQQSQGDSATAAEQLAECDRVSREPVAAAAIGFALMALLLLLIFDKSYDFATRAAAPGGKPVGVVVAAQVPAASGGLSIQAAPPVVKPAVSENGSVSPAYNGQTQQLGAYLFEHQMVNLELSGLILTVAMVGAIVIARRRIVHERFVQTSPDEVLAEQLPAIDTSPAGVPVYGTDNPRAKAYPER